MNALRQEKKTLMEKKDLRRSLEQKIGLKKQSIQRLEKEAINLEAEEARAAQKIKQITARKTKLLTELKDHTQVKLTKRRNLVIYTLPFACKQDSNQCSIAAYFMIFFINDAQVTIHGVLG